MIDACWANYFQRPSSVPIRSRTGWSIARCCLRSVPRVRMHELWRVDPANSEQAQDDATCWRSATGTAPASISSPTARRRRKLFQPFRHRARRGRHRQSRHHHEPQRQAEPGAARRRKNPPQVAGRIARSVNSCAPIPTARSKITCPVPSPWPAGAERILRQTTKRWRWTMPPRSMPRCTTCRRPAPTSIQLDEPWMQQHPDQARA